MSRTFERSRTVKLQNEKDGGDLKITLLNKNRGNENSHDRHEREQQDDLRYFLNKKRYEEEITNFVPESEQEPRPQHSPQKDKRPVNNFYNCKVKVVNM